MELAVDTEIVDDTEAELALDIDAIVLLVGLTVKEAVMDIDGVPEDVMESEAVADEEGVVVAEYVHVIEFDTETEDVIDAAGETLNDPDEEEDSDVLRDPVVENVATEEIDIETEYDKILVPLLVALDV
jgi:hypothetical protein